MHKVAIHVQKSFSCLLIALPLVVMLLVGLGIWMHASQEFQPPIYDALSYVLKAKNFWDGVASGAYFNPNEVDPVIRPFATVLISYPFGYDDDFRWFYFRTNAIPSLLLGLSVFVAAGRWRELSVRAKSLVSLLSITALSIPAVFQFAAADGVAVLGNWGFFDLALAAFGALAAAVAVRPGMGIRTKAVLISLIAVLIIYTKPAGLAIVVMLAGVWLVVSTRQWMAATASRGELFQGVAVFFIVYLLTAATLFGSEYFSPENYQFGVRGMELLRDAQTEFPSVGVIVHKLHISIGLGMVCLLVLGIVASIQRKAWEVLLLVGLVLLSGFWLWLGRTNVDHVRYFLPFPLMAFALLVPSLVEKKGPVLTLLVWGALVLVLVQLLLVLVLLFQATPKPLLQRAVGINLTSGQYRAEIDDGKALAAKVSTVMPRRKIVYYVTFMPKLLAFQSELEYRRNIGLRGGNSIPSLPVDWVREPAYRLAEITGADYVVFPPLDPAKLIAPELARIIDFGNEEYLVRVWLSGLGLSEGVVATSSSDVIVLEVVDRELFKQAAAALAQSHELRSLALEGFEPPANRVNQLLEEAVSLTLDGVVAAELISISVSDENGAQRLRVSIVPGPNAPVGKDWLFYAHQIYEDDSFADLYSPFNWGSGNTAADGINTVVFPASPGKVIKGYGVGVFQPNAAAGGAPVFLLSRGGEWNGARTVVSCGGKGCV